MTTLKVVRWLASAVFVVLVASAATAQPYAYVVEDLGTISGDTSSVAWAINANGDVVGWSTGGSNGRRAFVYTRASGMVALPGLPGRPQAVARDINDAGDIVGTADAGGVDLGHAVLWKSGSIQDLGTLGTGSFSEAMAINNLGQVVGSSYMNGGSLGIHGFLYTQAGGMVDLTPASDSGYANDINDAGQVTGYKTALFGFHAFRWQGGTFLDLGVLPGFAHSVGWAINASGQVAGNSTSASGNSERLVRHTDRVPLQNLGGVGEHNVAWGINASGHVVGTRGNSQPRALLYTDAAGLQELNSLIDPSLGWVLLGANDINDAGQIVGYGFLNPLGQTHAFRLTPTTVAPAVQIALTPQSTSVSQGQTLFYDAVVTNASGSSQTFDVWIEAFLPNGNAYAGNPIVGPRTTTLAIGRTAQKTLRLRVPARNLPVGPYTIRGAVGTYPSLHIQTSTFQFFVQ